MIAELCLTASGSGCAPQFGGAINLSSNLDNQVSLVRVKAAVTIFSAPDMGGTIDDKTSWIKVEPNTTP